ncbi:MAG: hypothetical protein AAGA46_08365 [Cyanobacteria bacterium P01_F01_bin.13]
MDANRRPTQANVKGNKKPRPIDPASEPHEHLVEYTREADKKLHDALDQRISDWFTELKLDIEGRKPHPWKWFTGLILVIFLGLNGFLYYQQAQQIQRLNNLVEQLALATQVEPSDEQSQ